MAKKEVVKVEKKTVSKKTKVDRLVVALTKKVKAALNVLATTKDKDAQYINGVVVPGVVVAKATKTK